MCMCTYVCTYDVYCGLLCVAGISSEQFAVMEQKLEKSWASEKALRAEVKLWKTKLQEVRPPHLVLHGPSPNAAGLMLGYCT